MPAARSAPFDLRVSNLLTVGTVICTALLRFLCVCGPAARGVPHQLRVLLLVVDGTAIGDGLSAEQPWFPPGIYTVRSVVAKVFG